MAFHNSASGPTDMHGPYAQVFANAAARTGDATVYTASQSVAGGSTNPLTAYQVDTNTEYILSDHSPTAWVAFAGGGGGEANTGANVGGGVGNVFRDKTGVTLNFRTLVQGASMLLTQAADTVTVALGALTAALNASNQDITALRTATFNAEVDNGNSGTADTIDFATGQKHRSTLTDNATLTLNAPGGPCNLMLRLIQDATGGRSVTWAAGTGVSAIRWPASTAPAVSSGGANAIHLVAFYYDGTDLYGVGSLSFG